ncbi:AAA family ATPase [Alicyclobacillus fastidiosus]|uniref:AAA family ATPase n=1 Tax=Alicyclobacillus fastidiosus TaxID=392011 RepID=A0ABY6ZBH0_9BACL|nr:P-loop NTPase [Alicyclobacillus fastidiosus]WAH40194.1 AAA family ATPase [Alicyclobacillus fastidiosus]GMA61548.1 site-determining protein [Alicyclobacillus fastidiosus]
MNDQAARLRARMQSVLGESPTRDAQPRQAKVIAVGSGKGGVGKSNFCVNFGLALARQGVRVLVMDTDVGFANIEVLLNVTPSHNLLDVLSGRRLADIVEHSPYGLSFISGGNGLFDSSALSMDDYRRLLNELRGLCTMYDLVLLDCGAGVNEVSHQLIAASDELILVTTPEPTSMTDAYAFMKFLVHRSGLPTTRVVVNRAMTFAAAKRSADTLMGVTTRFLDVRIETLGYILEDATVSEAVMRQVPVIQHAGGSRASSCYLQVAANFVRHDVKTPRVGVSGFFDRLLGSRLRKGGRDSGHSA